MSVIILRGDAAHLPLPDESADLIVTSPPYWGLRSYTDGGEHYDGQIGSEATPREFLDALLACTREWMRVLKPSGSIFVNLGDKYSDRGHGPNRGNGTGRGPQSAVLPQTRGPMEKSLLGMPWRYALGCMDDLGLILRAEIVWAKPNGLPESVTDRVRRSHEQVFHFTKQPRYFAAVDEVREPSATATEKRGTPERYAASLGRSWHDHTNDDIQGNRVGAKTYNPLGKLPGSVWEIPSQPLVVPDWLGISHFAAFPMELPRRIILGWSPPGICTACGEGRRPVADKGATGRVEDPSSWSETVAYFPAEGRKPITKTTFQRGVTTTITGYACACPDSSAPVRPAVILDPFAGTGTTMLVASAYGRTGIGVDRSADYCRIAQWRTKDPAERARALGVPKPPPVPEGQGSLFDTREVS